MTEDRLPLNELLQKAGDGDFLRAVAESQPATVVLKRSWPLVASVRLRRRRLPLMLRRSISAWVASAAI